jgi:hypothetical protein
MHRVVLRDVLVSARSARVWAVLAIAGSLFACTSAAVAAPNSAPDATYVVNGDVYAVARSGNTVYLGGDFSQIGPRTGALVSLSETSGSPDLALPKVTGGGGYVSAVVSDGHGGEYIGGTFTHVGGIARANLAHILANDTVDPNWNPDVNGSVYTVALSGNTVYFGGNFAGADAINGTVTRTYAAAVDATTGVATGWNPVLTAAVDAVAVSGTTAYLGGEFVGAGSVDSTTRDYVAAVNASTGTINNTWNPGANGAVQVIVLDGSTVYLGGDFHGADAIGSDDRNYAAAVDATSGSVTSWNPNANDDVEAIAVSGSVVYLGGDFGGMDSMNGGDERDGLAAVDATTGAVTSWNPGANEAVYALAVDGGTVYAAGAFSRVGASGGEARNFIAAIDATTGAVTSWNPNANEDVYALALSGTNVVAGGYFSSVGGVERDDAAAINAADGTPTAWNPDASDDVSAIAVSGNTVYLGGYFAGADSIGTSTRDYAAAVDATTGAVEPWNPSPTEPIHTVAVSGNTVYLGGDFHGAGSIDGSVTRNYAAAVDATTGLATAWNPDANDDVSALAVSGNTVYLGGDFHGADSINGAQPRNYAAAVDATTGIATGWDPDADGTVLALAVSGNTVYLGGDFDSINGSQTRNSAAAVDATTGVATSWNPDLNGGVEALALSGNTVYIAGSFSGSDAINATVTRNRLASVDASTGIVTAWNPAPDGDAYAIAVASDGTVYAGGAFNSFDLDPQAGFASFSEPPANTTLPQVTGVPAVGQTLACSTGTWTGSTPQNYAYQWVRNGVAIAGATLAAYILAPTDAGQLFSCTVTASNLGATQASATSATVAGQSVIVGTVKVSKRTGAITFTETLSDPGALHWVITFQNGKFGVFSAKKQKKTKCRKGKIKLAGKCRSATVVYAQGSTTVTTAGTKTFTVKPDAAGKKAFKHALTHHKTLTLTATLSFQSNHGGSPVVHKRTISFKPVKPSKHKHKKPK